MITVRDDRVILVDVTTTSKIRDPRLRSNSQDLWIGVSRDLLIAS